MTEKREQIIKAASELIHVKGFNNTSIDDILQRTGVKKGNFYFYFKSKEELGFAVIEHHMEEFHRHCLAPILASEDTPFNKLIHVLDALETEQAEAHCCGGCPFGNMALELSDVHEGFRKRLQAIFQGLADFFQNLLKEAADELIDGVNLHEVSQFIVAGLEGGIMLAKVHKSIIPLHQCLRQLKQYLFALQRKPIDFSGLDGYSEKGTLQ